MKKELNIQHSTIKTENSAFNNQNPPLPKGWVWVRLGEIAEIISGVSFKPNQLCKQDVKSVRILRGGNIQNDNYYLLEDDYFVPKDIVSNDQLLRRYDIILVSSTGSKQAIGKAAIIKEELNNLSVGAFLRIIRIYENIQKKYIGFYFYTLSYRNYIREIVKGVNINNIKDSYLSEMFLPLPPLPEQQRIVAKIEELFTKLDAGVDALKKAKEQIKRYRQAVLKYAFEGKLTEEWRKSFELLKLNDELKETQNPQLNIKNSTFKTENSTFTTQNYEPASVLIERIKEERKKKLGKKYKELLPIETSELPELPEGWVWVRLGEIVNDIEITNPQKEPEKEFMYLDINSIDNTRQKIVSPKKYLGKAAPSRARQIIKAGDILFSTVRTYLKNIAMVDKQYDGQIASTGFCVIRPNNMISNKLVFFFVQSDFFLNPLTQIQRGTSYPAVRVSDVLSNYCPLPPLPEQHRIVEEIERRFSVADEVGKAINNSIKQAERLRQSILKKAFEGKLVPQDPNDEPADKLLERVRKSLQL